MTPEQTDLVRRPRKTPLYDGGGECSDAPDEAADMIEALAGGWRDIKDAPKDGTMVLVWCGRIDIAVWRKSTHDGNLWHMRREGFSSDRWTTQPTHWQPLPAPPEVTP